MIIITVALAGQVDVFAAEPENSASDLRAVQTAYNNQNYRQVVNIVERHRSGWGEVPVDMLYYEGASLNKLNRNEMAVNRLSEFLERANRSHYLTKRVVLTLNEILLDEAREEQTYLTALSDNSESSIRAYLNRYPQGEHVAEMTRRLDSVVFVRANTKFEYERYLREFPNGRHIAEARQRISNFENQQRISTLDSRISDLDGMIARDRSRRSGKVGRGFLFIGLAGAGAGALMLVEDADADNEDDDYMNALLYGGGFVAIGVGVLGAYFAFSDAGDIGRRIRNMRSERRAYERELETLNNRTSLHIQPTYDIRYGAPGVRLTLNF